MEGEEAMSDLEFWLDAFQGVYCLALIGLIISSPILIVVGIVAFATRKRRP